MTSKSPNSINDNKVITMWQTEIGIMTLTFKNLPSFSIRERPYSVKTVTKQRFCFALQDNGSFQVYGSSKISFPSKNKKVLEKKPGLHCFTNHCCCFNFGGLQKDTEVQKSKGCPSRIMSLRKLRLDHYKQLLSTLVPLSAILFGAYQQFLHDHDAVSYRNKSKMFGGKQLPEGKEAWY